MMNSPQEKWFERLRNMAEQAVKNQSVDVKNIDSADITKLINDIQVFQAELEIQNDELRTSLDELEKSRTRFSRLFDMAPAGYIILDEAGIILDVNQTMMDMLHKHRDDLMRKPFSRFIAPDDQGLFLARFTAFYKNPADKIMEIRLIKGSNSIFYARLAARFIPLETYPGKPDIEQFCLIVTDITETKRAENELKKYAYMLNERNKELQCLFSISGLINDPANSMDDIIGGSITLLANAMQYPDNACGRIKYKNREYTTQNFIETKWKQSRDIVVNNEAIGCVEIYYLKKMPVIQNSPFLEEEEALINSVAMRLGQTIARQQAEARILHLEKAESLGRLAGAVAHHYNNLLTVVMGNLDMALIDLPEDCESAESLTHAMEAARRASKLGSMMLAYLGQTNAPRELLDLSRTCKEFLPALQADMPSHITLEADLQETGPAVTANARQVQQILAFLITNAREAIGDKTGVVYLDIRRVCSTEIPTAHRYPVDFRPGKTDYACMEVTDTGAGIPENDVDKIFEPFYSTKFTGRGLGLPVALGAVKTHSGCMTVATRPGRGTRIMVFLPVTDKTDQALPDNRETDEM
jgi:PAS domain S-box-containing protein